MELILIIDDQQFYLDEMAGLLSRPDTVIKSFLGPEIFAEQASKEEIENSSYIVVDYDFNSATAIEKDLAGFIRRSFRFKGKLILCSLLDEFSPEETAYIEENFDLVLCKERLDWNAIHLGVGGSHV